jgi:hypothetical protein
VIGATGTAARGVLARHGERALGPHVDGTARRLKDAKIIAMPSVIDEPAAGRAWRISVPRN